jgi:hypothetical protein
MNHDRWMGLWFEMDTTAHCLLASHFAIMICETELELYGVRCRTFKSKDLPTDNTHNYY